MGSYIVHPLEAHPEFVQGPTPRVDITIVYIKFDFKSQQGAIPAPKVSLGNRLLP